MTDTIQIAFRHGLFHSILDAIVCIFTFSKFSHAEIIIDGVWYSSTMKDGVRQTDVSTRKGKWTVYTIKISKVEFYLINNHINHLLPRVGYDWLNIALWLFTKKLVKNHSEYCFEFIQKVLKDIIPIHYKPTARTLINQIEKHLKDRIVKIETIVIK